jgi:hypothetical protein
VAEQPRSRTARIVTRRFASSQEADRHDLEFWMQIPESERVLQVWRLSQELWLCEASSAMNPDFVDLLARSSPLTFASSSSARMRWRSTADLAQRVRCDAPSGTST